MSDDVDDGNNRTEPDCHSVSEVLVIISYLEPKAKQLSKRKVHKFLL